MLEQWRAGLRVSEALALETRDLHLDTERPTLRVRQGKGRKARVVPVHPELQTAFIAATSFGAVGQGRLGDASRYLLAVGAAGHGTRRWRRPAPGRRVGPTLGTTVWPAICF